MRLILFISRCHAYLFSAVLFISASMVIAPMAFISMAFTPMVMAKDIVRINNKDTVRINDKDTGLDNRIVYKIDLLKRALELTTPEYGEFEIIIDGPNTTIKRAILEINSGKTINTFMAITTSEWEAKTRAIKIPVRRGILNYRVLSVHKDKLDIFAKVKTIDDLKKLNGGVRIGWATADILKQQGFKMFEGNTLDGLYQMLNTHRIDYIPRGANEVYEEISSIHMTAPDLVVEPTLALFIPSPYYIFVSPNEERLAKRIEAGLELMIKDGSLKALFYSYYQENLRQANFSGRKIIHIGNPLLPADIPFERKELWFENDSPANVNN